jgi:hypothetical protein
LNANGRYDIGEGFAGLPVLVYGAGLHLKSDDTGKFTADVAPGYYWMVLFQEDGSLQIQEVSHHQENTWVLMPMSGGTE